MESCPAEGFVENLPKQPPLLELRGRSKSLDAIALEMEGDCITFSRDTACVSIQSSPIGTLTSAPPAFSHFDQPENSCNDVAVDCLQFNESSKAYVKNIQPNIGLVDGVESSRDSKQLNLEKVTEQPSLVKPCPSQVGTSSELESKVVLTDDVLKGRFTVRNAACYPRGLTAPLEANPDGSATADGPVQLGRFKVRPVLFDAGGRHGDSGTQMDDRRYPTNDNRSLVGIMTEHNAIMTTRIESLERAVLSGKTRQSNVNTGQMVGSSGRDFHSKGNTTTVDNEVGMLGALSTLADRMKTEMENVQCRINNMSIELRALKSKNKQMEHLYEEQKKKTAILTLRLNEEREKVQSLKWTLKKRDSGAYQGRYSAYLSSGGVGSGAKLDKMQDWNAIADRPANKPSTLKRVQSFDSVSSLGASHDIFTCPKEGFFTQQQHEPSHHVQQQQANQQHHTASPYLHLPTSSTTQQGRTPTSASQKQSPRTALQLPASTMTSSKSDPKLVSVSDLENFNQTSVSNASASSLKAADASRNGYGASRSSPCNGLSVHGGPSGLALLVLEKGEKQPKSNTKQGSTAGAAISQMPGAV